MASVRTHRVIVAVNGLARSIASVVLALLLTANLPARAEKRVALVVGIDRYDKLAPEKQLRNAVSDTRAVTAALQRLGFSVQTVENAGRLELNQAWAGFLNRLGPGDTVAFYFAGHAVEIGRVNYLVPRDIPKVGPSEEELLKSESISLARILDDLRERAPAVTLVILDACRNNPFSDGRGRSIGGSRGLARVDPPRGTFVMYSAGTGQVALDRLSDADPNPNSVYTRTLLPLLTQPGRSLAQIARDVRSRVRDLSLEAHHEQTPAYYDELVADVFLAGAPTGTAVAEPPPAASPQQRDPAAEAWAAAKDSESESAIEAFIRRFGDSFYADLARERLATIRQKKKTAMLSVPAKPPDAAARPVGQGPWTYKAATEAGNGSTVAVDETRGVVTVTYTAPSPVMANLAVRPGSVLFRGQRNGDTVNGQVTLYYGNRCGARSFPASGQFRDGGITLMLSASSVIIAMTDQTCDAFMSGAKMFEIRHGQ